MLPLLLTTVVSASPQWLVVPAEDDGPSRAGAEAVSAALVRTGRQSTLVGSAHPAAACLRVAPAAQPPCLAALDAKLLVVSGAALRDRFALTVSVVGRTGTVLEEAGDKGPAADVADLAISVLAMLSSRLALVEGDSTTVPASREPRRPLVPLFITAGLSLGAAAVAIGLAISGSSQVRTLASLQPGQVPYSSATVMEQQANSTLTAALLTGIGSLLFSIVTGVLWLSSS